MYDIVIIGAGTAGMSAAIYGVRSGKKVLLLEEKNYGGQIVNTPEVENYPGIIKTSGFEFATNLFNQAKSLGAEIKYEKAVEIKNNGVLKEVITNKETKETKGRVIERGAENRELKLDKEKEHNTYVFVLLGIAYSASIGGMGTLVGSPPNAIVASNLHLTFSDWLWYGLPIMLILMPLMVGTLFIVFKPKKQ